MSIKSAVSISGGTSSTGAFEDFDLEVNGYHSIIPLLVFVDAADNDAENLDCIGDVCEI
jgi:hypothetical protein